MEKVEDIRHTIGIKEIYSLRSQTIERVFADAKELHGMRYTQYRGLAKVKMELTLKFACMNLKKLAMWKFRKGFCNANFFKSNYKFIKIKKWLSNNKYLIAICLQSEIA